MQQYKKFNRDVMRFNKENSKNPMSRSKLKLFTILFLMATVMFFACSDPVKPDNPEDPIEVTNEVTSIALNTTSLSLEVGQSQTLTATVLPANATDKSVTWTSNNTSIASVTNGVVTANAQGTATITAKAGNQTTTCKVTVTVSQSVIAVTSISLDKTTLTLAKGQTFTLTASVKPDNATNKTVTWTTSNYSGVDVDNNGKVTAKNPGEATITAKAGDKTATCTVTVPTIWLNEYELELIVGEEQTLTATTTPAGQSVTWSSSNTGKVTVEGSYGQAKVVAKTSGTVNINATFGGQTVSCIVTVFDCFSQDYVTIDGVKWATRNVDKPGTFAAKASDAGMLYQWNRKIGWSLTDPVINSNGGTQWDGSNATGSSWEAANDPSPTGWRVPTYDEAVSLMSNWTSTGRYAVVYGNKCKLFGSDENTLVVPLCGYRGWYGYTSIQGSGEWGGFWTSLPYLADQAYAASLIINSSVGPYMRWNGINVRCVRK